VSILGIVAALPAEARCLVNSDPEAGALTRISDHAMLRLSGIGPDGARFAAKALLQEGATSLLSWGCAGALDPKVEPGSLMLPKRIIASPHPGLFEVDTGWHQRLYQCLSSHLTVNTGPLTSSPSILYNAAGKAALYKATGAMAVDMESTALAAMAANRRIPFMVVRAIADAASAVIPEDLSVAMSRRGGISAMHRLTLFLRPWLWPVLIRLHNQFQASMITLARVSGLAGPGLLAP